MKLLATRRQKASLAAPRLDPVIQFKRKKSIGSNHWLAALFTREPRPYAEAEDRKGRRMGALTKTAVQLSILAALAACDGSTTTSNKNGGPAQPSSTEAMSHDMGPFFLAETEMTERMMAAVGTSAGDTWVRKMIEHHRGAVEVSKILVEQTTTGPAADMARTMVEKETKEMADLQKLLREGRSDWESAAIFQSPMDQMHDAMMGAQGADAAETWMRKMLEYYRGGVAMSEVLLHRQGVAAEIRRKAVQTKSDQQRQVQMLQRMLRGEKMDMR